MLEMVYILTPKYFKIERTRFLERELGLCEQFFALDARNFHSWNHRQWVPCRDPRAREDAVAASAHIEKRTP